MRYLLGIDDDVVDEGNLREVNTEDGIGYYPDLQVIATVAGAFYLFALFVYWISS